MDPHAGGGGGGDRDRLPQWSHAETKEFLAIRSDLDRSFMETKRNKVLWEAMSARMEERGFLRTPDQCKSKWKNLVTRYKGNEVMEAETNRQFPFQDDMRRIFVSRMERLLSFEDEEEEEGNEGGGGGEEERKKKRKRKVVVDHNEEVKIALRELMRWQERMEVQWLKGAEERETERRVREMEWRRAMRALEEEREVLERRWREREEERLAVEAARAERRHDIVVALLTKFSGSHLCA